MKLVTVQKIVFLLIVVVAMLFPANGLLANTEFQGPTALKIVCLISHQDSAIEMLSVTGQQLNPQHGVLAVTHERYDFSGSHVEQSLKNLRDFTTLARGLEALGLWNGELESDAGHPTMGHSHSHAFLYAYKVDHKGKTEIVLHQPVTGSSTPGGQHTAFMPMLRFLDQLTHGGEVQDRSLQQGTTLPTIVQLRHKLQAQGDESSLRLLSQLEALMRKHLKM